jgi:hypothetical protein
MSRSGFFILCLLVTAAPVAHAKLDIVCGQKQTITQQYEQTLRQELDQAGYKDVTIKCTSCYRSPVQQAAACRRICGKASGCPGRCAPPGRSQHQKKQISTCDLSGLSQKGGVRAGCELLAKICNEKFGGKCGVGGYPGGSHHFGATDDHPSAWNQCAFVKAKLGIDTSRGRQTFDRLSAIKSRIEFRKRGYEDRWSH